MWRFLRFIALLSVYCVISSFVRFIALIVAVRFLALVVVMRFIALVIALRFVALVIIVVRFIAFIDAARFIAFCIVVSSVCCYFCSLLNHLMLIELLSRIFVDIFFMGLRFILLFTCLKPLCSAS